MVGWQAPGDGDHVLTGACAAPSAAPSAARRPCRSWSGWAAALRWRSWPEESLGETIAIVLRLCSPPSPDVGGDGAAFGCRRVGRASVAACAPALAPGEPALRAPALPPSTPASSSRAPVIAHVIIKALHRYAGKWPVILLVVVGQEVFLWLQSKAAISSHSIPASPRRAQVCGGKSLGFPAVAFSAAYHHPPAVSWSVRSLPGSKGCEVKAEGFRQDC